MPDEPLAAHTLAEAYLYLMATPCPSCGRGPLRGSDAMPIDEPSRDPDLVVCIKATCGGCETTTSRLFRLDQRPGSDRRGGSAVVNPTDEPSRLLDVGQWIMLFRMIVEAASRETDKIQARHFGIEAAQCLEEALKFYDEVGNDLPPPEALFTDASRERFREHPEQYSKQRLLELRSRLPTLSAMRSSLSPRRDKGKPWWRRWR